MTTDTDAGKAIEAFVGSVGDVTIGNLKRHTPADIIKAGTYQGFTDEEIQGLIDFYVENAHKDAEAKAYTAAYITQMNEQNEILRAAYEDSKAKLAQVLQRSPTLGRIGADGFPTTEAGESE